MDDHVGDTEQVRERLFLDATNAGLEDSFLFSVPNLRIPDALDAAGQEATGAAGGVQHRLTELWGHHVHGELSDWTWSVVFTCVPGALEPLQNGLVDVAEQMPVARVVEVDVGFEAVDDSS